MQDLNADLVKVEEYYVAYRQERTYRLSDGRISTSSGHGCNRISRLFKGGIDDNEPWVRIRRPQLFSYNLGGAAASGEAGCNGVETGRGIEGESVMDKERRLEANKEHLDNHGWQRHQLRLPRNRWTNITRCT